MISKELLRAIRNELPMQVTILQLGRQGPVSKQFEGHFRFICLQCGEFRATVNPRNNLAHCFRCGRNYNNIDLLMALGYDFPSAVEVLKQWLRSHRERHATSNS
jgi:DNA primase